MVALALFFVAPATRSPLAVLLAILFSVNVVDDAMYGPLAAWFAELLDTRVRYSGAISALAARETSADQIE